MKWREKMGESTVWISALVNYGYVYLTRLHVIFFILKNIYVFSKNIRLPLVPRLGFLPCQQFWFKKLHVVYSLRQMRKTRMLQSVNFVFWFCKIFWLSSNMILYLITSWQVCSILFISSSDKWCWRTPRQWAPAVTFIAFCYCYLQPFDGLFFCVAFEPEVVK